MHRERHTHFDRPVKGVEQQLCERRDLRRPVPTVTAVHEHGSTLALQSDRRLVGRSQKQTENVQPLTRI